MTLEGMNTQLSPARSRRICTGQRRLILELPRPLYSEWTQPTSWGREMLACTLCLGRQSSFTDVMRHHVILARAQPKPAGR